MKILVQSVVGRGPINIKLSIFIKCLFICSLDFEFSIPSHVFMVFENSGKIYEVNNSLFT